MARSRATLARDLRGILGRFAPISGIGAALDEAVSRTTLAAQATKITRDSTQNLAGTSRMSLGGGATP